MGALTSQSSRVSWGRPLATLVSSELHSKRLAMSEGESRGEREFQSDQPFPYSQ